MDVYGLIEKQFIADLDKSSEQTRKARLNYCRKFLAYAKSETGSLNEWNKELVNSFISNVVEPNYTGGTPRQFYSVVKRTFDAAKRVYEAERVKQISEIDPGDTTAVARVLKALSLPGPVWDVGKRDSPEVKDELRPQYDDEQVDAVISAARSGKLKDDEVAYLALETVYAYRREELSQIRPEHIDYDGERIFVNTVKHGEKRWQYLDPRLFPYLQRYNFKPVLSVDRLSMMFRRIEIKAGIVSQDKPHEYGLGWHGWRRYNTTVITHAISPLLGEAEAKLYVSIFFRWKTTASRDMADRYYNEFALKVDKMVLENHPVIGKWE